MRYLGLTLISIEWDLDGVFTNAALQGYKFHQFLHEYKETGGESLT